MEDSGFDSGDRVANFMVRKITKLFFTKKITQQCLQQTYQKRSNTLGSESSTSNEEEILTVNHIKKPMTSPNDNIDEVAFRNPSLINTITTSSSSSSKVLIDQSKSHHLNEHNKKLSNINTCKSLHRKLEQKVERAKKNFLHNEKFNQLENDAVSFFSLQSFSLECEWMAFTSDIFSSCTVDLFFVTSN